jgi:hypothetical protein
MKVLASSPPPRDTLMVAGKVIDPAAHDLADADPLDRDVSGSDLMLPSASPTSTHEGGDVSFNRNIITKQDAANFDLAQGPGHEMPATLGADPPASTPGSQPTQGDDFLTQLVKFIPVEILGFYTLVASIIIANTEGDPGRGWWLLGLFAGSVALAPLYTWRVGKVVRPAQNIAGAAAMAVYVFAVGGWFTTLAWYRPWHGAIAVALAIVVLALFNLKPLPVAPVAVGEGGGVVLGVVDRPDTDDEAA